MPRLSLQEAMDMSSLIKDVQNLHVRPNGWKAGLDINTDYGETYIEYRKTSDKLDMFARGYAHAEWNELTVWGDEDIQAGVKLGVSW